MGENHFAQQPTLLYGLNLFLAAVAYNLWARTLVTHHGMDSPIGKALGSDVKGKISLALYLLGMALSFVHPLLGFAVYTVVAMMWLVPDKRMEQAVGFLSD